METNNTIFQRSWKSESWKTKKTSRKQKKTIFQRSWWIGGSSQESPNIVFFLFSRGFFKFFGFSPWGLSPKESPNIVFCFVLFFRFLEVFVFFFIFSMGPPPKEFPNIVFLFFFFYFFSSFFCFFLLFSTGPLPKESPFEPDNEVKQMMLTKI